MSNLNDQQDFQIIRERMKERPLNRKRLVRRTVITAALAVFFGALACITFLVLEPVFSNILSPEEEPERIEIPLDEDEMLPSDMLTDETVTAVSEVAEEGETVSNIDQYVQLYSDIYDLVSNVQKSIVTVAGVDQDVDWFDNEYESKGLTTGLIVANNGQELLILCDGDVIKDRENIHITFYNGTVKDGYLKKTDSNTGLAIVGISINDLSETLLDPQNIANLGNSKPSRLIASPVIAIGRPMGNSSSVDYGMITAKGSYLNMTDINYEMIYTNIYGNENSNGVIVNMKGEILGIICQDQNSVDKNIIAAIGISELKRTIERLSNSDDIAVLGIRGTDVTNEAVEMGVPVGAYVTSIDMDSPAMNVGIQSGDVIVRVDGTEVESFSEFTEVMYRLKPEAEVNVMLMRYDGEQYSGMMVRVSMGSTN